MIVTVAALSDPAPERSRPVAAVGVRNVVAAAASHSAPPTTAAAPSIGEFRRMEAETDRSSRKDAIVAASRSQSRPILAWPASGPLTGWFGERRRHERHPGLDVDGDTGDPIHAAGVGVVEWAGPAPAGYSGYGLMVLIRHSSGIQTLYAHLSKIATSPGAVVESGDYLGAMGTTGNVTGSHLHFEVRVGGRPVNPADWLPAR